MHASGWPALESDNGDFVPNGPCRQYLSKSTATPLVAEASLDPHSRASISVHQNQVRATR